MLAGPGFALCWPLFRLPTLGTNLQRLLLHTCCLPLRLLLGLLDPPPRLRSAGWQYGAACEVLRRAGPVFERCQVIIGNLPEVLFCCCSTNS